MKKLFSFIVLVLAATFLTTSCEKEDFQRTPQQLGPEIDSEIDPEIDSETIEVSKEALDAIQKGREKVKENAALPSSLDIELPTGNKLQFFVTEEPEEDVIVIEIGECVDCSVLSTFKKLHKDNYTALDLFWAFSKPGTNSLATLDNMFKKSETSKRLQQGWAISKIKTSTPPLPKSTDYACNDSWFTSSIAGGFQAHVFKRLNMRPVSSSSFNRKCLTTNFYDGQCHNYPRYSYWARYTNTTRWAGKICGRSVQNSYNNHYYTVYSGGRSHTYYFGPEIKLQYHDGHKWATLKDRNGKYLSLEIPANRTWYMDYVFSSSSRRDYRLWVDNAKGYDQFDFMMTERP